MASILRNDGVAEIEFACDNRYRQFVDGGSTKLHFIRSIPPNQFLDALAHGRPPFSSDILREYVADDLSLLERSRADIVVGDFRLSLSVSARLVGIPYVNVTNAYWSPYAKPRFRMPSIPVLGALPPLLGDLLFSFARPLAFAHHARSMNEMRRAHGLRSLGWDLRRIYADGDLTLYADIPELIPIFNAPSNHRYIGPVVWSPPVAVPKWWNEATDGEPPIYVSLGSSGRADLLPTVIRALVPLNRPIVVATAGRPVDLGSLPNVWVSDFVPGEAIASKACMVVCNGGSPTTQQALAHGVPVIGIANNLDQLLNMYYVERFGAGSLVRADRLTARILRGIAERTLTCASYAERARSLAVIARGSRAETMFPAAIKGLLTQ